MGYITKDEANRKIALAVLNRRAPASAGRAAAPSTNLFSQSLNLPGATREAYSTSSFPSYGKAGASKYSSKSTSMVGDHRGRYLAPRRPIDGYLRQGSDEIEWARHPVKYPLGSAHGGLPWWHQNGQIRGHGGTTGLTRPVPEKHSAERALAGRYHQLLLAGRAREHHTTPMLQHGPVTGAPDAFCAYHVPRAEATVRSETPSWYGAYAPSMALGGLPQEALHPMPVDGLPLEALHPMPVDGLSDNGDFDPPLPSPAPTHRIRPSSF